MGPPTFTQQLESALTIDDGARLELTVKVEGDPEPQITWLKNEQIVTSSDVVDLRYKNGVASLTIAEVFPEDDGEYVCTATNSIGTVSTTCKLTINRKSPHQLCFNSLKRIKYVEIRKMKFNDELQ